MKKLLSMLSVVSLVATGVSNVIACGCGKTKSVKQQPPKEQKPVAEKQSPAISEQQQTPVVETQTKLIEDIKNEKRRKTLILSKTLHKVKNIDFIDFLIN